MAGYFSKTDFTPSTSNTYTVSFWVKINNFAPTSSDVPYLWSISDSDTSGLFFQADTTPYNITFFRSNGGTRFSPTNYMRDVNAWYHVHLKVSSGTGTLYYNGESVKTSITVDAQNYNGGGAEHYIHTYGSGLTDYDNLECVMSHFHFVDGTAYDPTVFGSTDSTTGEWKINTSPSVTYGTNGYFILKDGNTGTDHSGNGNNFTLTGTCTKTEDCPSNVFATLNVLATSSYASLTQGNNTVKGNNNANDGETYSTLGTSNSGKYYWEIKATGVNSLGNPKLGFVQSNRTSVMRLQNGGSGLGGAENGSLDIMVRPDAKVLENGSTSSVLYNTFSAGNILSFALDSDNGAFYYAINGTWQNSGNPASGASKTGAIKTWTPTDAKASGGQHVCIGSYETASQSDCNFGNGYFGTTAVSSAGTNASGNGIFEYDVPTGYTALSTKGLNL